MSGSSDEAAASVEALLDFCEEVEEHEEPPAVDKNRLEHWNRETWWVAFLKRSNTLFPQIGFLPETANVSRWITHTSVVKDAAEEGDWSQTFCIMVKNGEYQDDPRSRMLDLSGSISISQSGPPRSGPDDRPDVLTFSDLFTVSELGLKIQHKLLWIIRYP